MSQGRKEEENVDLTEYKKILNIKKIKYTQLIKDIEDEILQMNVLIAKKCEEDKNLGYELLKRLLPAIGRSMEATRLQLLDIYGARD